FGLLDCCPTTDGAAAAIICRADLARRFAKPPVLVKGAGLAVTTGRPYFDPTFDYLGFRSTQAAARQAYAMAGVTPADIDFAEVHDCFTWTEISNLEDLGFCKKGEGGQLVEEGRTALEGDLPVNPSGGLKSFGHPIGASGVRMIYECVTRRRRAPARAYAALAVAATGYALAFSWLSAQRLERTHLPEYGIAAWLAWRAVAPLVPGPLAGYAAGAALAAAIGYGDELLQGIVPGRYYDIRDVAMNALGAVLAVIVIAAAGTGERRHKAVEREPSGKFATRGPVA